MTREPAPFPGADTPAPATTIVHAGRVPRTPGAQVGAPLEFSSTFVAGGDTGYARDDQPTWGAFEAALGALEGGEALVLASGMAAVAAALSLVPLGGVVVAPDAAYNGTYSTLDEREARGELTARRVDVTDTAAVLDSLPGADLLWLESPTNPLLQVADLPTLLAAARERGIRTVVDNTFATPLLQRPLELGADVVVHSATKYLSGHSDVILGAVVTAATDGGRVLRERLAGHRLLHGAIAGPMETWLALRGLRTLSVRLERASANAAELARRLSSHPVVERVRYPGFGAMVSIEVAASPGSDAAPAPDTGPGTDARAAAADRVVAATRLWVHSTSLGAVESQLERRRAIPSEPHTVPVNLLRLSVGIEDVEDLWADLDRALHSATR